MSALCHYCSIRIGTTRDHIIAKSWGGRGQANLVPACFDCNQGKAASAPTCLCNRCAAAAVRWMLNVLPDKLDTCPPSQRRKWMRRGMEVAKVYGLSSIAPPRRRHLTLILGGADKMTA